MSRPLPAPFLAEAAKEQNRPTYLYSLMFSPDLLYTSSDAAVVFGGNTYQPYPIIHSNITQESGKDVEQITLTIGNADRIFSILFAQKELRRKRIEIKKVFLDLLSDPTYFQGWVFFVDNVSIEEEQCVVNCTSRVDVIYKRLPARTFSDKCPWIFKGNDGYCGYAGGDTSCNKAYTDCQNKSNLARFGGFLVFPHTEE